VKLETDFVTFARDPISKQVKMKFYLLVIAAVSFLTYISCGKFPSGSDQNYIFFPVSNKWLIECII